MNVGKTIDDEEKNALEFHDESLHVDRGPFLNKWLSNGFTRNFDSGFLLVGMFCFSRK